MSRKLKRSPDLGQIDPQIALLTAVSLDGGRVHEDGSFCVT
jgi:hypothetical protein